MSDRQSSWVVWAGAGAFPVLLYVTLLNVNDARAPLPVLLPAVLMALPIPLLIRRPIPALALMLAGGFAVTATLGTAAVGYSQVLVQAAAVGVVAVIARRRTSVAAMLAAIGTQVAATTFYSTNGGSFLMSVVFAVVAVFAGWTTGDAFRQRRVHAGALQSQVAVQAAHAERLRIARELHDMIAHSIGVIAIQAGMAGRVIHSQPAEARNALDAIEATSRQTLAELRQVLGGFRESTSDDEPLSPAPGLADLQRIATAAEKAGVHVTVRRAGDSRPLPAHIDLSAFRIVQEALTNVVRHADARECRVSIEQRTAELAIEIVDDGRSTSAPGTGYGIVGMRERSRLLHGEFDAGPRPEGGFRVMARIPVPSA